MAEETRIPQLPTPPGERGPAPSLERLFKFAQPYRVRYDEVDAQGFVGGAGWQGILQLGRVEYLRNLGLQSLEGGAAPVQVVLRRSVVEHFAPARFDDSLLIRVRAAHLGHTSCRFEYIVDNADTRLRLVLGEALLVCITAAALKRIAWPEVWRERLAEFEGPDMTVGQPQR